MTANSENNPMMDVGCCARFASAFGEKYPDCGDPSHTLVVMLMIRVGHLRNLMEQHGIEIDDETLPLLEEDQDGTITEERTVRGLREALNSTRGMITWYRRWVSKMEEDTPASVKWRKLYMQSVVGYFAWLEDTIRGDIGDDSA